MGVGNWSWRSHSGLSTKVVHVDNVRVSFERYRADAQRDFAEYARKHYADRIEGDVDVDFAWAREVGLESVIEDAIGDDYPYWNDEAGYLQDEVEQRYDELVVVLAEAMPGTIGNQDAPHVDVGTRSIAQGKWTELVVRQWENELFFGVGPRQKLNDWDVAKRNNKLLEGFVAMHLSACNPKKTSFYELCTNKNLPPQLAMNDREAQSMRDGRPCNAASLMIERTIAIAREADGVDYPKFNAFAETYGIEPSILAMESTQDAIEDLLAFVEELGELPSTVIAQYEAEYKAFCDAMLRTFAQLGEKPMEPDSAWTSKVIDLRPYTDVAVVELDKEDIYRARSGGLSPRSVQGLMKQGVISVMTEAEFDDVLRAKVLDAYPQEVDLNLPGCIRLFEAKGPAPDGGVAVMRAVGMESALEFMQRSMVDADALSDNLPKQMHLLQGGFPVWMQLETNPHKIREVLSQMGDRAIGGSDRFFDHRGDLLVTGLMIDPRREGFGAVYCTTSEHPARPETRYRPMVLPVSPSIAPRADAGNDYTP